MAPAAEPASSGASVGAYLFDLRPDLYERTETFPASETAFFGDDIFYLNIVYKIKLLAKI